MEIDEIRRNLIGNAEVRCDIYGSHVRLSDAYSTLIELINTDNEAGLLEAGRDFYSIIDSVAKEADIEVIQLSYQNTTNLADEEWDLPSSEDEQPYRSRNKPILVGDIDKVFSDGVLCFGKNDRANPDTQISAEMEADESLYEYCPRSYLPPRIH